METLKGTQTEKNLYKTFCGEARTRDKYNFYAEKAAKEGNHWVEQVFNDTALNEMAHARMVYNDILGLNTDIKSNLIDCITNEMDEADNIYKQFEEDARREGFSKVEAFYKELREVEELHAERFKETLRKFESGMYQSATVQKWQCMNCGYIHEGKEAPEKCPLCQYPQGYFKILCDELENPR